MRDIDVLTIRSLSIRHSNLTRMQMTHRDEVSAARDAAIYLLFMRTGLRVSELVGLDVEDVNLEKRFVRVMRKGSREDTVFFSDQAADALRNNLICCPLLTPDNRERALFLVTIGKYKGSRLSVRSVQNLVKKYGKAAVLEVAGLHVHSLRSSYATRSLEATRNLRLVQLQLNHKSPTITSIYVNYSAIE